MGWPHFAFLFAIFFVILFRRPLLDLIRHITSIDKNGIKVSQAPEAQREEQKKEAVQQLLLVAGDSIVLRDIETRIKTELRGKGLETDGDTIKVLIKHLAATQIILEFEQIYNQIFGSQIDLLKQLNEVAGQGKPMDFVVSHFENTKRLFPNLLGDWSLQQYLAFLFVRSLITLKDNIYHITNLGVEYLTWMARNGKSENRPL